MYIYIYIYTKIYIQIYKCNKYAILHGIIYKNTNIYIYICFVNLVTNQAHSLQLQKHQSKYYKSHLYSVVTTLHISYM